MPDSAARRGSIFAIGGREARLDKPDVLARFVSCCGGRGARLVVISTASRDPATRAREYDSAFRSLGVAPVAHFHQDTRADAADPAVLAAIDQADGVFFTGGSQLKLVSTIAGTPLISRLRSRHLSGLHIGGTSAGASAMSTVMIARGTGQSAARFSSVRMSPGLGFIGDVIVDQHFRERDRFGRLLTAVLCNPSMLGFGLDENTAFVLDAAGKVSVCGSGMLTVVDGSGLEATDVDEVPEDSPAAFAGMRLHALSAGWAYDLATRRVARPPPVTQLPAAAASSGS